MPATIIGLNTVCFGISSESTFGIAQTYSQTKSVETTQIVDHEGSVVGAVFHGEKTSVNLSVLCEQIPASDPGTILQLTNEIGIVGDVYAQNIAINRTNTGWMNATIDGVNYPAI